MNNLKYYRKKNILTQKKVADYLKITQPNYSNIETGKVKLNLEYANLLAELYKIPISELIDDKKSIYISKEDFETLIKAKNIISKIEHDNL